MSDSTKRFTDRVDSYAKYRPGYPDAVLKLLHDKCGLTNHATIADVGSGTGIFSQLLLNDGYTVYAVEPNDAMRNFAAQELGANKNFHSLNGTAETTGLKNNSVDLITCAQAFHWFNPHPTKEEFKRILKSGGQVALIWNNRDVEGDEFSIAYELLLQQEGTDYKRVNHQNLKESDFAAFFKDGKYTLTRFPNHQDFDEEGLIGRASSSSYVPTPDTEQGQQFFQDLKAIFAAHQVNGKVRVKYQTEVYLGEV
ncbi:methyltransferase family protein [Mucilaginibacter yixingensis]|uniref:Methyltransferase family protein n=1 Tax=Mucilaginibacter yixingensis TaxID=1295612 RepID=A0A2T5J7R3_9SPHI|nr:class I SAM-dependent methyltransferase [Mucilaginibacter yixingensis]PTQ95173.1 methyltransferase family protein [Mucilaginibacter yixingensis]